MDVGVRRLYVLDLELALLERKFESHSLARRDFVFLCFDVQPDKRLALLRPLPRDYSAGQGRLVSPRRDSIRTS